jgi:hypothetical protein
MEPVADCVTVIMVDEERGFSPAKVGGHRARPVGPPTDRHSD